MDQKIWKKCSVCKSNIGFGARYWLCSVSTCNGKKTGLVFCNTSCFERHLPGARHKDAGAVEEMAPKTATLTVEPTRRVIRTPISPNTVSATSKPSFFRDTLVVVSKLKDYIKAVSDMNTSSSCNAVISDIIRRSCDQAIENARKEGRKTVMDRDFKKN